MSLTELPMPTDAAERSAVLNVWGYLREYEEEREELLQAVDKVFRSGHLVLGEHVTEFEDRWAARVGVRHGVGVDNGTNALALGLRSIGVKAGDEVVTVSNTAAPTVVAIDAVGAVPRFVDVDPDSYLMDVGQIEGVLTERTRALLPVHLYGQCVDMAAVNAIADRHGLAVLEDCAQAHGATQHGQVAGSMSLAAAFSFYPTKVLGAYGDGGMTVTGDDAVHRELRRLRYYGMDDRYYVEATPGFNARLDEVQAAILLRRLQRLEGYLARRVELADRYAAQLSGTGLVLPETVPGNAHVYYLYVVRHPQRDSILEEMRQRGIHLNVSYRWPIHTMRGFAHLGYEPGDLPVTAALADQIFSLPMYPSLTDEEQDRVCEALVEVLAELDISNPALQQI